MRIQISGQHMSVGQALEARVEEELGKIIQKHCPDATHVHVSFKKELHHNMIHTEIVLHSGHKAVMRSDAEMFDAYESFKAAFERMTSQLQKHNTKLKGHRADDVMTAIEKLGIE